MVKKNKQELYHGFLFIVSILMVSILLIGCDSANSEDYSKYNEFSFFYDESQDLWFTQIQVGITPYNIPFYHHPLDLENIVAEDNIENIILTNRPNNIIIAIPGNSSSEMALAGIEISKITGERFQLLKIPTTSAVNERVEGLPYADCNNANEETVVISFYESKKNVISSDGRCIILEFKEGESIKVADAFAYRLIKIM